MTLADTQGLQAGLTHGRTWSRARWIHTERDVDECAGNGFITKREGHAECTKFENELQKEELVTYEVIKQVDSENSEA